MKLKKLLASCVLIAAMGITLTGCSFNVGDVLDEIRSVANDESSRDNDYESSRDTDNGNSSDTDYGNSSDTDTENSSTDNESSSDTNIENPNSGTWVLTETKYYAYMNGEAPYVVSDDGYTKYRCYYSVTDDNFVKFQTSGGFTSPTNPNDNSHIDAYHLCSIPDTSYPAGGPVTLQVKTYSENIKGDWYPVEGAWIGIVCEDKEEAAGMDPYLYFLQGVTQVTRIKFYSALKDKYDSWVDGNTNDTLTVNMPEEAKNGDRIAIVFQQSTAGYGRGEYNAGSFAMWIYTFTE